MLSKKLYIFQRESEKQRTQGVIRDVRAANFVLSFLIEQYLLAHLVVINNTNNANDFIYSIDTNDDEYPKFPELTLKNLLFSFNCDPEVAEKVFLEEMEKSEETREAFRQCESKPEYKGNHIRYIAHLAMLNFYNTSVVNTFFKVLLSAERLQIERLLKESFDLKAKALGKWTL